MTPQQSRRGPGEFVLYWMHNAIRVDENPALETAVCLARQNGLPLVVYQGLVDHYPYASDRLHAFILQGHREVAGRLAELGIKSVCHVQTCDEPAAMLVESFKRCAVMVTEQMPIEPFTGWVERLVAKWMVPIASVDASCLVPVGTKAVDDWLDKNAEDRSYDVGEYRAGTESLYAESLAVAYPEVPLRFQAELPVDRVPGHAWSMDLGDMNLARLIGRCRVDHSIPPVAGVPGGGRAGYRCWNEFLDLQKSETNREHSSGQPKWPSDPVPANSQMSAYLHFGMVSPFRLAREAAENGLDLFLDNLLYWRESAFHFCNRYPEQIDTTDALPRWAVETLQNHRKDPRSQAASWETLLRGRTTDAAFNDLEKQLLRRGTIPGDFRKRWGKMFLDLTRTPHQAMQMLIDLNHRLSIDGRDPNSYGGILSCLGQFDRPSNSNQPVYGKLRQPGDIVVSDSNQQGHPAGEPDCAPQSGADRVDFDHANSGENNPVDNSCVDETGGENGRHRVAVIGAGIGGLVAARTLQDQGFEVTVFEKSRGVGGRLATRRSDIETTFDHGASTFTATDRRFTKYVRSWIDDGIVKGWDGHFVRIDRDGGITPIKSKPEAGAVRLLGIPTNNSIAKHLAVDLTIHRSTRIVSASKVGGDGKVSGDRKFCRDGGYRLVDQDGKTFGDFDSVILNLPPVQAADLIGGGLAGNQQDVAAVVDGERVDGERIDGERIDWACRLDPSALGPCWTMMLVADFETASTELPHFDAAIVDGGVIEWLSREDAKPDRAAPSVASDHATAWVVQASASWSADHLEDDPDRVGDLLAGEMARLFGRAIERVHFRRLHRWRYAKIAGAGHRSEWDQTRDDDAIGDRDDCEPAHRCEEAWFDSTMMWGACGDWICGGDIQAAFLSGQAVAGELMRHLTIDRPVG